MGTFYPEILDSICLVLENLVSSLGNDGSGWTSSLVAAEVAAGGVADSFVKATHFTRTRRAHQVNSACLSIPKTLEGSQEPLQFTDGVNKMSKDRPQFLFWNKVIFLELCFAVDKGNFYCMKSHHSDWFLRCSH